MTFHWNGSRESTVGLARRVGIIRRPFDAPGMSKRFWARVLCGMVGPDPCTSWDIKGADLLSYRETGVRRIGSFAGGLSAVFLTTTRRLLCATTPRASER